MPNDVSEWTRVAEPGFELSLCYPGVTPQGVTVERADERVEGHAVAGDFERIHLSSQGSGELYVELTRFPGRSPEDEYQLHRPSLIKRFGSNSVSALTETTFIDRPAWRYSFRWDGGQRAVLLFDIAGDTYRVIYDPRSELNERIVRTLTVVD